MPVTDPPCVACQERPGVTLVDVTDAVEAWLCARCAVPFTQTVPTVQTMFDNERGT